MLAASSTAGIALLVLGAILVVAAGAALYLRGRSHRARRPTSRAACGPGPADAALETPLLQKLQGWGVVLVAFFVVWIPYTWLREPSENLEAGGGTQDRRPIERGHGRRSCSPRRTSWASAACAATDPSCAAA